MCLIDINLEKTKELQQSFQPIIGYKLLNNDNTSIFQDFEWQKGLNISNRRITKLTEYELEQNVVYRGFHFATKTSKKMFLDLCGNYSNKLAKFSISPKDIVAVGFWDNISCFVATKTTWIEDV